jgi:flagellin-like hook-associated protein FlgL
MSECLAIPVRAPTTPTTPDSMATRSAVETLAARLAQRTDQPHSAVADCQQELWVSIFFDGTGNNEKIDAPTFEHSNVARLYRAADDSPSMGRIPIYVPGIGTPFREIGDRGGKLAMAVAQGGEARLEWAMRRLDQEVREAAARAQNPVNKIRGIHLALFGFSRGAAQARAFARRVARRCKQSGAGWAWADGGYPFRLYFMGLFDTVASVGVPAAARRYAGEAAALMPLVGAIPVLMASQADGHSAWASDLRIPAMVERCVHYCAAHEIRNSFPLDSVLEDGRYPANCHEVFYPGVHSDVGGGYRPGEGGRNLNRFAMMSLVPLRAMYDEAVKAGVPLRRLETLDDAVKDDFLPPTRADREARQLLSRRFNRYLQVVGAQGRPIGETILAHMKLYFRWRIVHIGRKLRARRLGEADLDTRRLNEYDAALAREREAKQAEVDRLRREYEAAKDAQAAARSMYNRRRASATHRAAFEQASERADHASWALTHQEATLGTMPSRAEELIASLERYDQQFLEDSARVRAEDPKTLRPFARILREAWEMEPLTDPDVVALFDDHITDSLAGFAMDRTRATDPRRLYQGGDNAVQYARAADPEASRVAQRGSMHVPPAPAAASSHALRQPLT